MKVKPTSKELEILKILWDNGPSTVRFINEEQNRNEKTGYTTTLKVMQIMYDKGFLDRDESSRSHIYKTKIKESDTKNGLLSNLLNNIFGGSTSKMVLQALGTNETTKEERDQIRELLDKLENKN
ncbi:MAG: BlaI/MecI/CopY family transcriptional regulator [Candidatus Delongbacteria bacterium]|nr:BlaI/MecI/CopY family transcriptional regulator [Candidatus Delongbacteria bacterium]MBN2836206.1 BlaI/MecI/CopY family transcriptional regulator [Candidatus Delongbacteria bacterium]